VCALAAALAVAALLAERPGAAAAPAKGAPADAARADPAVEKRRDAIARELVRVGAELRRAIERGDAAALLARVPEAGLRCGERTVPKARVASDLAAPDSWLHGVFFGGLGYAPPPGTARSVAALLLGPDEVVVVVSFVIDPRAGEVGRPCLDFRAEGVGTPGVPICFEERRGRWWIVESLYPCG
jgi:hypothetical protein